MSGHDVPAGWEHGQPVTPPFRLPEEFLTRREGVRVGNVLETEHGCARIGQDRGAAC